jgi:hypothetical protein
VTPAEDRIVTNLIAEYFSPAFDAKAANYRINPITRKLGYIPRHYLKLRLRERGMLHVLPALIAEGKLLEFCQPARAGRTMGMFAFPAWNAAQLEAKRVEGAKL